MPLTLTNVTQAAVENEVSQQYRAARGANPRVVHIQGWQAPDPNGDFVRAFYGGRAGRARAGNEVEVTTEKIGPGRVAVFLVPNRQNKNPNIQQLARGTLKLKVGEANIGG